MNLEFGIHDAIPEDDYHALPALSSSTIHTLIEQSPRHAWQNCRWLNPEYEDKTSTAFDLGKAAHKLMLGEGSDLVEVEADDWRTKAAKDARDKAYAAGKIPLLAKQMADVEAMVKAGLLQIVRHDLGGIIFCHGKPEQTVIWQEQGVTCKARVDWLSEASPHLFDYKTTSGSAHPDAWQRQAYNLGSDIQAAWYLRGMQALKPVAARSFYFVVQEVNPPYALSVIDLTPAALDLADLKIDYGLRWWKWCLANDAWPAFGKRVATIGAPGYHEYQWKSRLEMDGGAILTDAHKKMMLDWQRPLDMEAV